MRKFFKRRTAHVCFPIALLLVSGLLLVRSQFDLVVGLETVLDLGRFGPFGDLFGGMLNPIVAILALLWIKKGVQIQQRELAATQRTLAETATAQKLQVQVAAVTALVQLEGGALSGKENALMELKVRRELTKKQITARSSVAQTIQSNNDMSELQAVLGQLDVEITRKENEISSDRAQFKIYFDSLKDLVPALITSSTKP